MKDAATEMTSMIIQYQIVLDELLPKVTDEESSKSDDDSGDEQDSGSEASGDHIVDTISLSEYNLKEPSSNERS